jgi:1-acyl-sn-glycerol-3-phosphate acyltransferase
MRGTRVRHHDDVGFWLRFAVTVLRPPLMVFTRRDWHGIEHIPADGGVIVAVNHISHFDPLPFAHFIWDSGRSPRFLAKAGLFGVPLVGQVLRGAGQIPVNRDSADAVTSYAAAVEAVERGECICIYPEGTLTRDPGMWPMVGRTGAARVALVTGAPVIPVAQWGAQEVLAPYTRRPHLLPRRTMHLRAGPPVDLSEFASVADESDTPRRATERIMAAITTLLVEMRDGTPPARRFDPRSAGVPTTGDPGGGGRHGRHSRRRRGGPHTDRKESA